ncbi:hypothetical protein HY992_04320 [Candidatus Micrarchaeota archaeon]|nr:hypothetical protein [Candidatus Micrarchaeota archaeon]
MVAESFLAELAAINILKGILAALSLVFLAAFYAHWIAFKYSHNTMEYIAKRKIVEHNKGLAVGLLVLSIGLIVDSLNELGVLNGSEYVLAVDVLLVIAVACMGYWYYKLSREGRKKNK